MKIAYLTILLVFSLGAQYFVAPTGKDTNNGASATPFATLQKAANAVQAGDTVTVRPGKYVGCVISRSGTAGARIIFVGEPGAIVDRPGTSTDGINLESASFVTVRGFSVVGVPRAGIRSAANEGVQIIGNVCDRNGKWGILTGFSQNVLVEDNTCSNSVKEHGIYVGNSADNPIIRRNNCFGNSGSGIQINADASLGGDGVVTNAIIEQNTITGNGLTNGAAINLDGVQKSFIRNNILRDNHRSGIAVYKQDGAQASTGNTVVDNDVVMATDGLFAFTVQNGAKGTIEGRNKFTSGAGKAPMDISADSAPLIAAGGTTLPPPPADDPVVGIVLKYKSGKTKEIVVP